MKLVDPTQDWRSIWRRQGPPERSRRGTQFGVFFFLKQPDKQEWANCVLLIGGLQRAISKSTAQLLVFLARELAHCSPPDALP